MSSMNSETRASSPNGLSTIFGSGGSKGLHHFLVADNDSDLDEVITRGHGGNQPLCRVVLPDLGLLKNGEGPNSKGTENSKRAILRVLSDLSATDAWGSNLETTQAITGLAWEDLSQKLMQSPFLVYDTNTVHTRSFAFERAASSGGHGRLQHFKHRSKLQTMPETADVLSQLLRDIELQSTSNSSGPWSGHTEQGSPLAYLAPLIRKILARPGLFQRLTDPGAGSPTSIGRSAAHQYQDRFDLEVIILHLPESENSRFSISCLQVKTWATFSRKSFYSSVGRQTGSLVEYEQRHFDLLSGAPLPRRLGVSGNQIVGPKSPYIQGVLNSSGAVLFPSAANVVTKDEDICLDYQPTPHSSVSRGAAGKSQTKINGVFAAPPGANEGAEDSTSKYALKEMPEQRHPTGSSLFSNLDTLHGKLLNEARDQRERGRDLRANACSAEDRVASRAGDLAPEETPRETIPAGPPDLKRSQIPGPKEVGPLQGQPTVAPPTHNVTSTYTVQPPARKTCVCYPIYD